MPTTHAAPQDGPDHSKLVCDACGAPAFYGPGEGALICVYCGASSAIPVPSTGQHTDSGAIPSADSDDGTSRFPHDRTSPGIEFNLQHSGMCPSCELFCLVYQPDQNTMVCSRCKKDVGPYVPADTRPDGTRPSADNGPVATIAVHTCTRCAGEVSFYGNDLSERCPYCDGPVIRRPERPRYQAPRILPFSIDHATAESRLDAWLDTLQHLPREARDSIRRARVLPIYAPFWLVDTDVVVHYTAGILAGSRRVHGVLSHLDERTLIPASQHFTEHVRDALGPWPVEQVVPFDHRYLAGIPAEMHRSTIETGLMRAINTLYPVLHTRALHAARHSFHPSRDPLTPQPVILHTRLAFDNVGYTGILLPFWIRRYVYQGHPYMVVCSGHSGQIYGQRPFSLGSTLRGDVAWALGVAVGAALLIALSI